jgi:hypothetical protein
MFSRLEKMSRRRIKQEKVKRKMVYIYFPKRGVTGTYLSQSSPDHTVARLLLLTYFH